MHATYNPDEIAPPASRYSHAVEVRGPGRWLHVSGQIGLRPDGSLPADSEGQIEVAWTNLLAVLRAAGMTAEHLVKITAFITDPADVALVRKVRDRHIGGTPPASTLLVVAGLARPDFRFELEAVAAMPEEG